MTNLAWNLKKSAEQYPEHAALRLDEQMLTYSEFDEMSSRVAGWLHEHGHSPGDRVGIMLPNVIAFPVIYYGILRAGLIAVPMNPLLKEREVRHYIDDSGAELIFAWHTASEEVAVMTQGLMPQRCGNDATWSRVLAGHGEPERRAARVFTLDV